MQNIPRWKKSDRGSSHVRHGLDLRLAIINNGNCTEWSAIWSEIKRVITKSHDREVW